MSDRASSTDTGSSPQSCRPRAMTSMAAWWKACERAAGRHLREPGPVRPFHQVVHLPLGRAERAADGKVRVTSAV
ncbi:hypothetical protein [Nonomuraea rubra]|uniref:hypothetical protein n=1 Tax=Nonomuraea rubra TaxID=46180 RepID=UPI0031E6D99A